MPGLGIGLWAAALGGALGALAPVLSGVSVTEDGAGAGTLALTVSRDCTVHVWIGPVGTLPTAEQVRDGTGADAALSQPVDTGAASYALTLPDTLQGSYRVSVVAQVGDGPLSNVATVSPVAFDTGAASGLSLLGTSELTPTTFTAAPVVPFPAGTADGDLMVIGLLGNGGAPPAIAPPAGFSALGAATATSGCWLACFAGPASGASATLSLGAQSDVSAVCARLPPGATPGTPAIATTGGTGSTAAPTVPVGQGDLALSLVAINFRAVNASASPAAALVHAPDNKSASDTAVLVVQEGLAAGTSPAVTVTHNFSSSVALTVGLS